MVHRHEKAELRLTKPTRGLRIMTYVWEGCLAKEQDVGGGILFLVIINKLNFALCNCH